MCEHVRLLKARGHKVLAVHRSATATTAMPPWSDVKADADVVCGLNQQVSEVVSVADIDVVVVGIFHQVRALALVAGLLIQKDMSWSVCNADWCSSRSHGSTLRRHS